MTTNNILPALMREKISKERMSEREAARQLGLSPSTVGRALGGGSLDIDTLLTICDWLGVSLASILDAQIPSSPTALSSAFAALIETEPELAKIFGDAIERVVEGSVDPVVLKEVTAYAAWRLNTMETNNDAVEEPEKVGGKDQSGGAD